MKKVISLILFVFISVLTYGQTPNTNYKKTINYKTPVQDGNQQSVSPSDKSEQIVYFDELGRPIQSIAVDLGGNQEEIVTHYEYDLMGRQSKSYLPYAVNIPVNTLDYVSGVPQSLNTFYQSKFPQDFSSGSPINPYSQTVFENSPSGKVLKQAAPGSDWKVNDLVEDHTVKLEYKSNIDNDVFSFGVSYDASGNPTIVYRGYYKKNQLFLNRVKNENWKTIDGKLNTKETYKDKSGRVVLVRSFDKINSVDTALNEYYIYDDFGNLIFVLPPKASETLIATSIPLQSFSNTVIASELLTNLRAGFNSTVATVTISNVNQLKIAFNFGTGKDLAIKTGIIKNLMTSVQDVVLGNITNGSYNFQVSIVNNNLVINNIAGVPLPFYTTINTTLTVLLPTESTMPPIPQSILDDLCYRYKYDNDNRLVEKKIPGKGVESIVYDKLNRPVLSQDANLKLINKWLFVKYDIAGRVVYSGEFTDTRTSEQIQTWIDNDTSPVLYETKTTVPFSNQGIAVHYTNSVFPITNFQVPTDPIKISSILYYDNYNFDTAGLTVPTTSTYGEPITTNTKTLVTGSKVRTLDTTNWTTSLTAYDDKARPIVVQSKNDYLKTTDIVESKLNFIGNVLETTSSHTKTGVVSNLITKNYFVYDHAGRLEKHTQQIGANPEELISYNKYNDLGQLVQQKVGDSSGASATSFSAAQSLQTIDYGFNVRGWMTKINDTSTLGTDLFAYEIKYNKPTTAGTALFNGNISQTFWKTANDSKLRNYSYTYDNLSRIKKAVFASEVVAQNNSFNLESVNYDKNGNITFMHSAGDKASDANLEWMDFMTYEYEGNKLKRIAEQGHGYFGFKTPIQYTDTQQQYYYDANGNLTQDRNKDITAISYNHLNLPLRINFSGSNRYIDFVYNAAGVKESKSVVDGTNVTTTYYAGGYTYQKLNANPVTLQYVAQPQGYAYPNGGVYQYVYQYKDQVGNVRLSYAKGTSGIQIVEESNYSPFGMLHKGYNNIVSSLGNSVAQKFKFNGKESEGAMGLNVTEMDFRQYDPTVGRFFGIDLLAEHSYGLSPYHFTGNNPIMYGDPSGLKMQAYSSREPYGNNIVQPLGGFYDYFGNTQYSFLDNLKRGGPNGTGNGNGGPAGYGFGTGYNGAFMNGSDAIKNYTPGGHWDKVFTGYVCNNYVDAGVYLRMLTGDLDINAIKDVNLLSELRMTPTYARFWVSEYDTTNWLSNLSSMIGKTLIWISGAGTGHGRSSYHNNDNLANAMRNARGVGRARNFFYNKYKGMKDLKNATVTNYSAGFGLEGLVEAGIDPVEQFVGNYSVNIEVVNGNMLQFTLLNNSSFTSFFYGIAPSWGTGPMSNYYQTYIFTEPIDNNRK